MIATMEIRMCTGRQDASGREIEALEFVIPLKVEGLEFLALCPIEGGGGHELASGIEAKGGSPFQLIWKLIE
ncbi:MAG: hypothetical protein NTW21_36820 [Verrucomicrobia bacterium]|nr:hypothetical protein [Verrucomicrobiota bacterium]